jgi:uncharacterized protein with GYD domain
MELGRAGERRDGCGPAPQFPAERTLSPRAKSGFLIDARKMGPATLFKGLGLLRPGRNAMPTYVVLSRFTQQGVNKIEDTTKRAENFRKAAKKAGVSVKELLWTQGQYDVVTVLEGADEASVTALGLSLAKQGFVRSETLRAFTAAEVEKILEKMA